MAIVNVHESYENFAHDINEKEVRLVTAFVSLFSNNEVDENEIKILAFDRGPNNITGQLEYQGVRIPMKISIPWLSQHAGTP